MCESINPSFFFLRGEKGLVMWVNQGNKVTPRSFFVFDVTVKVGIPEFLRGIANGVETHVEKLESEFGDLQKLLVARTLKLKKLEIPCKHRKLILKHAQKYRVGLWRPQPDAVKV